MIRISPSFKSLGELAKNMNVKVNNSNNIQTVSESKNNKSSEKNVKFKSSFKSQKNQQLVKDLNEIKNQIVKDTKISKKRQFNNEILNLFKYNPRIGTNLNKGGLDMGLFERKKTIPRLSTQSQTLVTAGESAVANSANKINVLKKPAYQNYLTREGIRNYNFRYDGNGNLFRNQGNSSSGNKRRYANLNNLSISRSNNSLSKSSSQIEITNTSPLENEVQKKVKTILKKDYIGRYKRSPYLRLLE